jgi:hypothetical protein
LSARAIGENQPIKSVLTSCPLAGFSFVLSKGTLAGPTFEEWLKHESAN